MPYDNRYIISDGRFFRRRAFCRSRRDHNHKLPMSNHSLPSPSPYRLWNHHTPLYLFILHGRGRISYCWLQKRPMDPLRRRYLPIHIYFWQPNTPRPRNFTCVLLIYKQDKGTGMFEYKTWPESVHLRAPFSIKHTHRCLHTWA